MNALRFTIHLIVAVVVLVVLGSGPASAQSNCAPFSGTVHGDYYKVTGETSKAWHMVGDFAIGKDVFRHDKRQEHVHAPRDGHLARYRDVDLRFR